MKLQFKTIKSDTAADSRRKKTVFFVGKRKLKWRDRLCRREKCRVAELY